jgi:hypothetical protein
MPARKPVLPSRDQLQSDAQTAALRRNLQRHRAVLAAIKLGVTGIDNMYDSFPMSKFDLMAMGRGAFANTAVASVQTNDDNRESETQTETVRSPVFQLFCTRSHLLLFLHTSKQPACFEWTAFLLGNGKW